MYLKKVLEKAVMILAVFAYDSRLKIKRFQKNIKINSIYYLKHSLHQRLFREIQSS